MTHPTIADAKALAQKHRALGVLILSFADGQYAFASYGHTRRTCDAMRQLVDQLDDMIRTLDIEIPAELGEARSGSVASKDDASRIIATLSPVAAGIRNRCPDVNYPTWNPDSHVEITLSIEECRTILAVLDSAKAH